MPSQKVFLEALFNLLCASKKVPVHELLIFVHEAFQSLPEEAIMNDAPPTLIEDFYDKFLDLAAGELGRQEIAEVTEILEKYLPEIA